MTRFAMTPAPFLAVLCLYGATPAHGQGPPLGVATSADMAERQFHDAILQGGRMPVEMVRARLKGQLLERDHEPGWRFADP
jgi:hypothetical protein